MPIFLDVWCDSLMRLHLFFALSYMNYELIQSLETGQLLKVHDEHLSQQEAVININDAMNHFHFVAATRRKLNFGKNSSMKFFLFKLNFNSANFNRGEISY